MGTAKLCTRSSCLPPALLLERALGAERKRVAESSEEEVEWRKLDAQMKQAWDESDWTKLDALVRDSFSLYFKDDSGESPPPQG